MKKRFLKLSALCLSAGISFAGISVTGLAAESSDAADVIGTLGFAQCSEFLNVRSGAEKEAEVIGKLYNNGSVEILDADENGWYHIRSGNVDGYVASEYIATGDKAQEIAAVAGYTTAEVGAETLNVRAKASDTSDVVGSASESEELEVVADNGDWVKVVLPDGVYGYVSTEYVYVSTVYPTAVTLEEEQAASQRQAEAEAEETDDSYTYEDEAQWSEASTDSAASADSSGADAGGYTDTASEDSTAADSYTDTAAANDTYADTSASNDAYTDAAAANDTYTDTAAANDTYADTSASNDTYTDAAADTAYTDSSSDTAYTDNTASDSGSADETAGSDTAASTGSATGAAIANYACQFVGNPYVWGGTSLTNGADCSGFVLSVFANFGISLPHEAASQAGYGTEVSYSDLQPGDLVFYSDGSGISHVAIYVGGGSIVHAANASSGICYSNVDYSTPVSCRRLV